MWDLVSAQDLLYYIEQIGKEGLNPADYDPAGLAAAIKTGDPLVVSKEATDRFDRLSSDLALGHVKRSARIDWFVTDGDLDAARQDALLRSALAQHNITAALNGLLPTHPQYAALKAALEMTPASDSAKIARIRLNMDRWRWLPRDLGRNISSSTCRAFMRRWSRTAPTAGSIGRSRASSRLRPRSSMRPRSA